MELSMKLKEYIAESFSKEYGYRIKIAADCDEKTLTKLEACLQKYDLISATKWSRTPIEENPSEFVRRKGVRFVSEVCSSDIILKYPVNDRILEVWIAANMGIEFDRVIAYGVKDPRKLESEIAAERLTNDKDRFVTGDDALLNSESMEHYTKQQESVEDVPMFGEGYTTKFLEELARIKAEKGADYFRRYPTKGELMGDDLRDYWNTLNNGVNMGKGSESTKEVDVISQSSRRN